MNFRRISKYLCALTLAATCTITTMATTVSDVATNHWAYNSIIALAEKGYMVPTSQGEFKPNQVMNYFEVAGVLAKATGYVDIDVATNIDETFKAQIKANYEKQKATLATYAAKYSSWDKSYDQQVAYLLGRGYISTSELDAFVTKSGTTETKTIMTKEDLAVWMVRLLGKENTAKSNYTSTGFADEKSITEANRPHVAYLKTLGLINGTGNFAPKTQVSKALCAKMMNDTLDYKDKLEGTGTTTPTTESVTVNKVLTKNSTEYYVSLVRGSNTSYYTLKMTTEVKDASGKVVKAMEIPADTKANVVIAAENGVEYITSMTLASTVTETPSTGDTSTSTVVSGKIMGNVTNDVLRLSATDGTVKTYLLQDNCTITLNGATATVDKLTEGLSATITVTNGNTITKIVATGTVAAEINDGELVSKKLTAGGYIFAVSKNSTEANLTVPETATIRRNGKAVSVQELRTGDALKVTRTNGIITLVEATGTRQNISGTIQEIHLAQTTKIVVNVNNQAVTYVMANDAELYDNSAKKYIGVRDLHLGQKVAFILDSKEVISLDVEANQTTVKLMGTITGVSRNNDYIDVLVDYDPISGENKVYKRIEISSDTSVTLNGKNVNRSTLEEDMEVLIIYKYLDDKLPQTIQII